MSLYRYVEIKTLTPGSRGTAAVSLNSATFRLKLGQAHYTKLAWTGVWPRTVCTCISVKPIFLRLIKIFLLPCVGYNSGAYYRIIFWRTHWKVSHINHPSFSAFPPDISFYSKIFQFYLYRWRSPITCL